MKKKIISILLVVLLILGYGWSKLTKASDIKEFSAKFIVNNSLINTGDIIELNYQYKINGQGKNISNISLTHSIPSNFEVINLPDSNWTVEGNMIKANDLNSSDGMYSFTIKLKAKSFGKIDTFGIATIEYNYNLGNDKTKEKVTETVIAKAFDKNNNELTNLIIDNTSVNLQAKIINKRVENNINYIYLDEPLQVEYRLIPEGEVKVDRKPVDIVLVIDTSTSMRGSKIEAAKLAAKDLINTIYNKCIETNCDDKVSIIGFSTQVNINNPLVSVKESNNKESLINKIDSLNANGFTNIHDGLLKAKANLNSDNRDVDKHIIVLTDGMPNYYINNYGNVERDTSTDNKIAVGKVYEEIDNIKNIGYKVHFIGLDTENGAIKKRIF
ncbi:vWA domain-containing protein [Thermobrachium celere]|uniref:vWA domain-containing protein n=1 Tax=Thermobrachium celere TaxID=53422 RepID=UPI0019425C6B|nr:vWA domain-containing protein [Thermobrachium celere]GFR36637.1 hypothetical protein TCEA9_24490 [Thermobrachium celere]